MKMNKRYLLDKIQRRQEYVRGAIHLDQVVTAAFALLCDLFLFLLDWRWGKDLERALKETQDFWVCACGDLHGKEVEVCGCRRQRSEK